MPTATPPLIYDEHCSVLAEWRRRRLRGKTLVCLDAHLDLQLVNDERLRRLKAARSAKAFEALEKPDHLLPDGNYVYGIENFLYPARRLGYVARLVWVKPPHVRVEHSAQVLGYAQQMDGVTFDELCGFRRTPGGWYEGELLGLPLTICSLEELSEVHIPPHSLLDIDVDYFLGLPEDRAWTEPSAVVDALARSGIDPAVVSIARSVGSGFLPLRYRYFADWLRALLLDQTASARHYAHLLRADRALAAGERGEALALAAAELDAFPECAATHYLLASAGVDAATHAARAAALDAAYGNDPARTASETVNRRLDTPIAALEALYAELKRLDAAPRPEAFVALGLAYADRGNAQRALECYRRYGGEHPGLALAVAGLLTEARDRALRRALLETAAHEDASTTSAHMQLAELDAAEGRYAAAREHLEIAHRNAPAWDEPLDCLRRLHDALEPNGTNPYALEIAERTRRLERLFTEER